MRSLLDVANGKCGFTNQEPVFAGKLMDGCFTTNRDVKNPLKWLAD